MNRSFKIVSGNLDTALENKFIAICTWYKYALANKHSHRHKSDTHTNTHRHAYSSTVSQRRIRRIRCKTISLSLLMLSSDEHCSALLPARPCSFSSSVAEARLFLKSSETHHLSQFIHKPPLPIFSPIQHPLQSSCAPCSVFSTSV